MTTFKAVLLTKGRRKSCKLVEGALVDCDSRSLKPQLNRLHGPPKENKLLRRDGLKGLLPYIRAVGAVVAAAHDGYSRLEFLSPGCTQGTGDSSEFPNPG